MMKTINDIVEITSGFAFRSKNFKDNSDTGYPIIRIQNLNGTTTEFKYWDLDYDEKYLIYKNDILLSLSGNVKLDVWEGPTGLLNQRIIKIDPKNGVIKDWLFYLLQSIVSDIEKLSKKSIISNISVRDLKKINVKVPSVAKQKEIAEILNKAKEVKTKRQQQIEALSALKQSIFLDMFGEDNKLTNIKINEIIDSITAGLSTGGESREKEPGEFGVLTTSAVTYGIFDSNAYKVPPKDKIADKNLVFPTKSSILVSRMNTKELVGAACIVEEDYNELFIPDRIWKVEPNVKLINPYYLISVIQSKLFRIQIDRISTGTSGSMQNISQKNFKNLEVPYPDLELQNKYATKVSVINENILNLNASLKNLQLLYDSLLHNAFNGELFKEDINV